jgi:hypothetical protein
LVANLPETFIAPDRMRTLTVVESVQMSGVDVRLKEMSLRELREIAAEAGIRTDGLKKRDEFVSKLTSLENIDDVVKAWENSLPRLLDQKSLKELSEIQRRGDED